MNGNEFAAAPMRREVFRSDRFVEDFSSQICNFFSLFDLGESSSTNLPSWGAPLKRRVMMEPFQRCPVK